MLGLEGMGGRLLPEEDILMVLHIKMWFYVAGWLLTCVQSNWRAFSVQEGPAARNGAPTSRTQISKAIMCLHCLFLTNVLTVALWSLQYLQYWTLCEFNREP